MRRQLYRLAKDVVRLVVLLGLGGHQHGCKLLVLVPALNDLTTYEDISLKEIEALVRELGGQRFNHWTIHVKADKVFIR